jgi:hypothetical protein
VSFLDPLWSLAFYAFVALLAVVGVAFVWESVGLFRDVLAMVLTRTSDVGTVREGRVEISGTARAADRTLRDPVSGAEAVAYEYRVTQEEAYKDDLIDWTRWGYMEQADGGVAVPFYVEDETGRVRVEPGDPDDEHAARDGAVNLYAVREENVHVDGGEHPPESVRRLFGRTDVSANTDRGRVYASARIEPGDEVYVLGTASFDGGDRLVAGGDGRFVVAGASQLRTLLYNAGWGVCKFVGGLALALVCGAILLFGLADLLGVRLI